MSLHAFCHYGKSLLELDQSAEFVRFIISGEHPDGQVVVVPELDRLHEDEQITIHRDFDSVLGVSEDILVDADLAVNPVSRKEDALSKNIHVSYHFEFSFVRHLFPSIMANTNIDFW